MTIYTVKTANSIQQGQAPAATLIDCTNEQDMVWATPAEYILPTGYTLGENIHGQPMIFDASGEGCELYVDQDGRIGIVSSGGIEYAREA